jgi:hypothetical protein
LFCFFQQAVPAKGETKQDYCMKTELLKEGKGQFTWERRDDFANACFLLPVPGF